MGCGPSQNLKGRSLTAASDGSTTRLLTFLLILGVMLGAGVVYAENGGPAPDVQAPLPPEVEAPPPDQLEPPYESDAADEEPQQLLSAAELDQLVAPIALYPDTLLAQIMMARPIR